MSAEQNRKIAIAFVESMPRTGIDGNVVTDDAQWWVPGTGWLSRAQFMKLVEGFGERVAGPVTLTVEGVTAEGDRVAVEAQAHAALKNGKIYRNTYHFLFIFRDGKICQAKEYNDTLHAREVLWTE
jgi:ketosteroid isomerase-like protein